MCEYSVNVLMALCVWRSIGSKDGLRMAGYSHEPVDNDYR